MSTAPTMLQKSKKRPLSKKNKVPNPRRAPRPAIQATCRLIPHSTVALKHAIARMTVSNHPDGKAESPVDYSTSAPLISAIDTTLPYPAPLRKIRLILRCNSYKDSCSWRICDGHRRLTGMHND